MYELSNRPEWAAIPLQGVISQFEQVKQPLEEVQKTNTRRHPMPFGAETQPEGGTRFRIWAPACPDAWPPQTHRYSAGSQRAPNIFCRLAWPRSTPVPINAMAVQKVRVKGSPRQKCAQVMVLIGMRLLKR